MKGNSMASPISASAALTAERPHPLLQAGFRPFFLLGSAHGTLLIPIWAFIWQGLLPTPSWSSTIAWHAHEILGGFVAAGVAGFLLTAVPVWTDSAPIRGLPLLGLVSLWCIGRVGFALAWWLDPLSLLLLDVAFLPMLAATLARRLLTSSEPRHWSILAVLILWSLANVAQHARAMGYFVTAPRELLHIPAHLVVFLVVLVGGRLIPFFTRNALEHPPENLEPTSAPVEPAPPDASRRPVRDYREIAVLSLVALAGAALLDIYGVVTGLESEEHAAAMRLLAGCLLAVRWWSWRGLQTLDRPLLWSLHLAFAWIPIGLWLEAASELHSAISEVAGLHALGIGGFGGLILALMSRVALGHTGRPLVPPRPLQVAYLAMSLCAGLRVLGALVPILSRLALWGSATAWVVALGLFLLSYAPLLCAPRVDGRAG